MGTKRRCFHVQATRVTLPVACGNICPGGLGSSSQRVLITVTVVMKHHHHSSPSQDARNPSNVWTRVATTTLRVKSRKPSQLLLNLKLHPGHPPRVTLTIKLKLIPWESPGVTLLL